MHLAAAICWLASGSISRALIVSTAKRRAILGENRSGSRHEATAEARASGDMDPQDDGRRRWAGRRRVEVGVAGPCGSTECEALQHSETDLNHRSAPSDGARGACALQWRNKQRCVPAARPTKGTGHGAGGEVW